MIFEHGLICEREGIAVETKVWLDSACRCRTDRDRAEPRNTLASLPQVPNITSRASRGGSGFAFGEDTHPAKLLIPLFQ